MDTVSPLEAAKRHEAETTFTVSSIHSLLSHFDETSPQTSEDPNFENWKEVRRNVSIAGLVQLGSAVLNTILRPLSADASTGGAGLALAPMRDLLSVGISQFIFEIGRESSSDSLSMHIQDAVLHDVNDPPQCGNCVTQVEEPIVEAECSSDNDFKDEGTTGYEKDPSASSADEFDTGRDSESHCMSLPFGDTVASHARSSVTKNVPPHILYTVRGVLCELCWMPFKSPEAVEDLLTHTRQAHPIDAPQRFLREIRRKNAFDKIIGNGLPYCNCQFCETFALTKVPLRPLKKHRNFNGMGSKRTAVRSPYSRKVSL